MLRAHDDRLRGLAPVVDARVETLILGSFPSAASLDAGQYYAHPRNQFWRIVGALVVEPLAELPYATRLSRLLDHSIGLWDVVGACERAGSLDAAIRNTSENDLMRLSQRIPRLRRVLLNGKLAGRAADQLTAAGYAAVVVPSSSPAFAALSLEAKIRCWRQAFAPAHNERARGRFPAARAARE